MNMNDLIKNYKDASDKVRVTGAANVAKEMEDLKSWTKECFVCFHLDAANQIILREVVTIGLLNSCQVHPREVFRQAILNNSAAIIISHNHPSGQLEASSNDIAVTKQIKEAGKIIGIALLDHVIVTQNGYLSMKDLGII